MSYFSDIVRAVTGKSVGQNLGQAIGTAIGGPAGGAVGGKIGDVATRAIDTDRGTQQGQSVAVDVPSAPSETSTSGSTDRQNLLVPDRGSLIVNASYGGNVPMAMQGRSQPVNLPAIIGGGVGAVRSMGGMLGLAGGAIMVAPTIIDMVTGEEKKLRVTRRLRSQVKQAVQMFGAEVVAENMGTSVEVVFYILTKKMRNDGSYVTKAAVRKTRQTVRKMKHLCDMYDDLRPPARRAPARRATTSKVMQIKN
jgi:hypothetical protein